MTVINLKPPPKRDLALDPNRKALAGAIALHAGARRDLQVAEQAVLAAKKKWWNAEARLDELRKEAPPPGGYLSDDVIAMIASDATCDVAVLDQSAVEAAARMKAFENDSKVWQATAAQCDLAVRAKGVEVADAKENVEKAARVVICNSGTVTRLMDGLEAMQAELVERRVALRFIWGKGLNGELPKPDNDRIEKLLGQDLTGWENHPVHGVWRAAFDALTTDPHAALPTEFAGVA